MYNQYPPVTNCNIPSYTLETRRENTGYVFVPGDKVDIQVESVSLSESHRASQWITFFASSLRESAHSGRMHVLHGSRDTDVKKEGSGEGGTSIRGTE